MEMTIYHYQQIGRLRGENKRLKEEIEELKIKIAELEEYITKIY